VQRQAACGGYAVRPQQHVEIGEARPSVEDCKTSSRAGKRLKPWAASMEQRLPVGIFGVAQIECRAILSGSKRSERAGFYFLPSLAVGVIGMTTVAAALAAALWIRVRRR